MARSLAYFVPQKAAVSEDDTSVSQPLVVAFWLFHMPLGLAIYLGPSILATMHGIGTLVVAAFLAISASVPRTYIVYGGAYIVGSEVLWRMAGATLFWEYGKYALVLICLLGLLRNKRMKLPVAPTMYLAYLLPAIIPTIENLSLGQARGQISFNLSGPLAIMVSAWFFSQLTLSREHIERMLITLIAPITSIAALLLYVVLTASQIRWVDDSNFVTSGGYGPNQVSTILGLGIASVVLLLLVNSNSGVTGRLFLILLGLWFLTQGLLTFSRGGIMVGIIAASLAFLVQLQTVNEPGHRRSIPLVLLLVAGIYLLFPALDKFTGGALQNRFTDFSSAGGRQNILGVDLQTFKDHPLTGVGVGQAKSVRYSVLEKASAAHTEYSRAIAEHGLLGILAYFVLGIALLNNIIQSSGVGRMLVVALSLWAILTMFHAAMRLAAPSFAIGLSFATFIQNYEEDTASR